MTTITQSLANLQLMGFDQSRHIPLTDTYAVQCSNCAPTVVNGTPLHERGCPNEVAECKGCNTLIPASTARFNPYCKNCR